VAVRGIADSDEDLAFLKLINELRPPHRQAHRRRVWRARPGQKLRDRRGPRRLPCGRPGLIEERVAANESGEVPILKLYEEGSTVRDLSAGRRHWCCGGRILADDQ
jgi:hypothetical protein